MSHLRIIGGKWRGRKLETLAIPELKPSADRVRETLFNWLMFDIVATKCLDAFAGSGALGLEALSRGATQVNFCEKNLKLVKQLELNIEKLDCTLDTKIFIGDFFKTEFKQDFDLVFFDPPFHQNLAPLCLERGKSLVKNGGLIYLETEDSYQLETNLELVKTKRAGQVRSYLLKNVIITP